jgi:hypothetical protein
MYVYSDGSAEDSYDDYDSTVYWCLQTLKSFGPDDEPVHRQDCRSASRSCYEPI